MSCWSTKWPCRAVSCSFVQRGPTLASLRRRHNDRASSKHGVRVTKWLWCRPSFFFPCACSVHFTCKMRREVAARKIRRRVPADRPARAGKVHLRQALRPCPNSTATKAWTCPLRPRRLPVDLVHRPPRPDQHPATDSTWPTKMVPRDHKVFKESGKM